MFFFARGCGDRLGVGSIGANHKQITLAAIAHGMVDKFPSVRGPVVYEFMIQALRDLLRRTACCRHFPYVGGAIPIGVVSEPFPVRRNSDLLDFLVRERELPGNGSLTTPIGM